MFQALKDEGHDPEEYLFESSEKKSPVKKAAEISKFILNCLVQHCKHCLNAWSFRHFIVRFSKVAGIS